MRPSLLCTFSDFMVGFHNSVPQAGRVGRTLLGKAPSHYKEQFLLDRRKYWGASCLPTHCLSQPEKRVPAPHARGQPGSLLLLPADSVREPIFFRLLQAAL